MRTAFTLFAAALLAALIAPAALSLGGDLARNDNVTGTEDQPTAVPIADLLSNDDLEDPVLVGVSQPSNGFVYVDQLFDAVMYFPHDDFHGSDSFDYETTNGDQTAMATVTVVVAPTQDRPTAANDALAGIEDQALLFSTSDLFANDADIDGDDLMLASFTQPFAGSLHLGQDATTFTYQPDPNHAGTDTFIYTVSDGVNDDSALVTISVAGTPDPPQANDDSAIGSNTEALHILVSDLLSNDVDLDGDALAFVSVGEAEHATVSVGGSPPAAVYSADRSFTGTDSFIYTISDGLANATATVTVTVIDGNLDPIASDDVAIAIEDQASTFAADDVLANDTDPEGDELWLVAVQNGVGAEVSTDGTDIEFTPDPDYFGDATFTYTVADTYGGTAQGTVTVSVAGTDDPVTAVDDGISVHIDTETTLVVSANDFVVDGVGSVIVDSAPHGNVSQLGPNEFSYTPDPGATGEYSLTYTVTDVDGDSDTATIRLLVGFPDIVVTSNPQLTDPRSLYWAPLSGDVWILAEPTWTEATLETITFRLDGLAIGTEVDAAPFAPLVTGGVIQPLDTTTLLDGIHTFTAEVSTDAGLTYSYLLPFFVTNP